MAKIDLSDVTFGIPVCIDTPERARNLTTVVRYIDKHFVTKIFVVEQFTEEALRVLGDLAERVEFVHSGVFTKPFLLAKMVNLCAKHATTPILCYTDTDVLLPRYQYAYARKILQTDVADVVTPFMDGFWDLGEELTQRVSQTLDVEPLTPGASGMTLMAPGTSSVGGCFLMPVDKYWKVGGTNEEFVGWGYEDWERFSRIRRLGYRHARVRGPLFHMSHPREYATDSPGKPVTETFMRNRDVYLRMEALTKEQLLEKIDQWEWVPK